MRKREVTKIALLVVVPLLSFTAFSCMSLVEAAEEVKLKVDPLQRLDVRYRMFKTENMWTYLLLDTRNGRVWQVSISVGKDSESMKLPINLVRLIEETSIEDGRFTLYPTGNMWNYILLDQEDGRVWQCQFSMKGPSERFLIPILTLEGNP